MTIEPEFSLDQPRRINHLTPDGVLAKDSDRRREMKRIRELLTAGDFDAVAAEFEAMVRLWDPVKEGGVIERRRREAVLWRAGFVALQLA